MKKSIKNITPIILDTTSSQTRINSIVAGIVRDDGKIDVLINNAGFGYLGMIGNFTESETRAQFETNFFGYVKVINAALPYMRSVRKGLIININSILGLVSLPFYGVYSASKFALDSLTSTLRVEESFNNINFISIYPGSFNTNFWNNIKWSHGSDSLNKILQKLAGKASAHRDNPQKVADIILKIINTKSPKRRYIVGWEANLMYGIYRLTPYFILEWIGKKLIKKLYTMPG